MTPSTPASPTLVDFCTNNYRPMNLLLGKMIKSPFKEKDKQATNILSLVYSDVCRSMSTSARGGYNYIITFIDDLSRYGYIYLMKHKSKSFEVLYDSIMK